MSNVLISVGYTVRYNTDASMKYWDYDKAIQLQSKIELSRLLVIERQHYLWYIVYEEKWRNMKVGKLK